LIFVKNNNLILQINEARAHTVENLWITTEKLNILYHENWTRLASEELARFQEQVVRTLTDNLETLQHSAAHSNNDNIANKKMVDYEWNFARAFFYSLTVLTTIGESAIIYVPLSNCGYHNWKMMNASTNLKYKHLVK
jgi:hypothetical protein